MSTPKGNLFPNHDHPVHLDNIIHETKFCDDETYYKISIDTMKLQEGEKMNLNHITIEWHRDYVQNTCGSNTIFRSWGYVTELNDISERALKEFILIDDGSFYKDRLDTEHVYSNFADFCRLHRERLYNFSNEYAPLRIFRLKRVLERVYDEKCEGEYDLRYSTFWETEVLDHTKNVPCARTGHKVDIPVDRKSIFIFGGVTILADVKYRGQAKIPEESWFLYPLQDVWELSLQTGKWQKVADMRPAFKLTFDWPGYIKMPRFMLNFSTVCDRKRNLIYGCFETIEQFDSIEHKGSIKLFWFDPCSKEYGEQFTPAKGTGRLMIGDRFENYLFLQVMSEAKDAEYYTFGYPKTKLEQIQTSVLGNKFKLMNECGVSISSVFQKIAKDSVYSSSPRGWWPSVETKALAYHSREKR